ncbi:PAS domain S-box protein [Desulfococcaceae bacterium HSG7]|nr:PAS domain S-box protein [Desulfococcaceae bacterium HSG7]
MKNKRFRLYLALMAIFTALSLAVAVTHYYMQLHWQWANVPFHSTVEALGALIAVFMALMLLQREQDKGGGKLFLALGFLGMGLLDCFHAVILPSNEFVFLHTMANLIGGLFFALTWMPAAGRNLSGKAWYFRIVSVGSVSGGIWALLLPETLPAMVRNGDFTTTAIAINILAGVLFLAAVLRFMLDFRYTGSSEIFSFACMSLLFGMSGLAFPFSSIWRIEWWLWHLVRLTAYILVLWFVIRQYLMVVSDLKATIAKNKRIEATLRKSEQRFHHLLGSVDDMAWTATADGTMSYINPAAERIYGRPVSEFMENSNIWYEAVHPDDRETAKLSAQELFTKGQTVNEYRIVRPDGEIRWLHDKKTIVFDKAGNPIQMGGIATDITGKILAEQALEKSYLELKAANEQSVIYASDLIKEINERKQAEDSLRASEEKFKSIYLQTTIGMKLYDSDGCLIDANPACLGIFGIESVEEIKGFNLFKDPNLADNIKEQVKNGAVAKFSMSFDFETVKKMAIYKTSKSGRCFLDCLIVPLQTATGSINGFLVHVQDVTERTLDEAKLKEYRENLEKMVKDRTAELESANKELEDFSYSVSHDLRAPLRAIKGFSEIIARRHSDALNEKARHYFDNIIEAGGQMEQLIEDLLKYSRLGRRAVRHQPVPLGELLAGVVKNLAGRASEIGAHFDIPQEAPVIYGDPTLLTQIFTNLLDNALTYRRPDIAPQVSVTCRDEVDSIIIRVQDNGIGIAPEFHAKIFNMFQRLHSQDEYSGTGIGLAVVAKSAAMMNGQIRLESVQGQGSVFSLVLPRVKCEV